MAAPDKGHPQDEVNDVRLLGGVRRGAATITPSDTVDLAEVTRGINVSTTGPVSMILAGDLDANFQTWNLAAGILHPYRARRIRATGTSAGTIVVAS